jgi:hypothetical protein
MHPAAPQVPEKECVLAAGVFEVITEDRQASAARWPEGRSRCS